MMMTESQLLACGEDDYMNALQLAFFKGRLLSLQAQQRQILAAEPLIPEEETRAADPVNRASLEEERAVQIRERERATLLLHEIEAALRRIEEEEYGYCEATGEPIGVQRLLAHPVARLSVEAQSAQERQKRQFRLAA